MQQIEQKVVGILIQILVFAGFSYSQGVDSVNSGYMVDPAEEFWLLSDDKVAKIKGYRMKHIPVNRERGFISLGLSFREAYEYYDRYLWGIGIQDDNGYFLRRFLLHTDIRWNVYIRLFIQIQSSTIRGRYGGARPVQDLNRLAVLQLFAEQTILQERNAKLKLRLGKQSLDYSMGTLLDIRDANVRLSWLGGKLIFENRSLKIDAFFMQPIKEEEGSLDDRINKSQKLAGIWGKAKYSKSALNQLDFYYLFNKRDYTSFYQASGKETRHTVGMLLSLKCGNWAAYLVTDLQVGKFNQGNIKAWKIAGLLRHAIPASGIKPVLSIQGAISSGDRDSSDSNLQTFNPLYPSGVYYGYVNNAGSANMIVLHPIVEFKFRDRLSIKTAYYRFWRQRVEDGLYSGNGSYLLPEANNHHSVGSMWDMELNYSIGEHISMQLMCSHYKRSKYLEKQAVTNKDIFYVAAKTLIRL
ncbi:alginate export family protein [Flavitalea antarctica]